MTHEMRTKVTLFSTEWCGHCRRLKRDLAEAGIGYREVDVDEVEESAERIEAATGGYRTVPAVAVDGRLLVNPSVAEVTDALDAEAQTG